MVKVESLKKIGVMDFQIANWIEANYVYVENGTVDIIDDGVYGLCMSSILMAHEDMYDEFINESYNPTLIQYYQFLKMVIDGEFEKSLLLMRTILKDKKFVDEYEEILLFVSIIEEYKLDDLYIPEEDNALVEKQIALFKKYLLSFNYPMAKDFLQIIRKTHDCLEYKVMAAILDEKVDTIEYILRPDIYPSAVTNDNLKRMEREMLLYLELGDYNILGQKINDLNYIYQNQDCKCFEIMSLLIDTIGAMQCDKKSVSLRSLFVLRGDFNSVIIALLSCKDFYRVHDLIEQEIKNSKGFDIYLAILFILIHTIMYLNQRNMSFINAQMRANYSSVVEDILPPRVFLSKIDGNIIRNWEEISYTCEKNNINYYQKYLEAYNDGEYELAKDFLEKFCERINEFGMETNYDYLFIELEYLMEKNKRKNLRKESLEYYNQSLCLISESRFKEASDTIIRWCDTLDYFHPRAQALLAKCYYKMGKYGEALKLYEKVQKYYLYPADYEEIIIILYLLQKYDKIWDYFNKREKYDYASLKIYYIMSLVAIKQHNYEMAKDMLEKAKKMCGEVLNFIPDYTREFAIIDRVMKGENPDLYTLDDYIEYEIIEEDLPILDDIKRKKEKYKDDYLTILLLDITNKQVAIREKLEYLLVVVKILKREKEKVNLDQLYDYIEHLLATASLDNRDIKHFTLIMKNYQNL